MAGARVDSSENSDRGEQGCLAVAAGQQHHQLAALGEDLAGCVALEGFEAQAAELAGEALEALSGRELLWQ